MKRQIRECCIIPLIWVVFASCSRSPEFNEGTVQDYLAAKKLYTTGDLQKAEVKLQRLTVDSPYFYQGRFLLAKTYYYQKKTAMASEVLQRLLQDEPAHRDAELLYIRLLLGQDKIREAESRIDNLLSYDSEDPRLLYLKALTSQSREKTADTLHYLKQASLFAEEFARVYVDLGRIYYIYDRRRDAEKHISTALHLLPENSFMYRPVSELLKKIQGGKNEK